MSLKKWIMALAFAMALMLALAPCACALNLSGLDALMSEKKSGSTEGGKASALASLTGGSQEIVVGVVADALVYGMADEEGRPAGFDVEMIEATLKKANYANYSFAYVPAADAVAMLDAGDIQLLVGYAMEESMLSRVVEASDGDVVAQADALLAMELGDGAESADLPENDTVVSAQGAGKYLMTAAYLSGKGDETLKTGEKVSLGGRAYYVIGREDAAKVISAFDRALEKVDIAGTKDELWKKYFKTGFLFDIVSAVRRWGLNIWWQFRLNLIEENRYKMIFTGLGRTMLIALCAAILGVVLGCALALMRLSNIKIGRWCFLRGIASVYVDVIRGTPVVVQLMIMYYIILNSPNISKITVAIISFGLNSGAYVSEMVRGGILAVDKGQTEAGRSLGLSSAATMMLIVLPQTIKIIIPSLFNEIVMLLKETSVVGFIGLMDLTKAGDYIRSRTYSAFFPLLTVAAVYLIIVTVLTRVFNRVERRLRQSDIR